MVKAVAEVRDKVRGVVKAVAEVRDKVKGEVKAVAEVRDKVKGVVAAWDPVVNVCALSVAPLLRISQVGRALR